MQEIDSLYPEGSGAATAKPSGGESKKKQREARPAEAEPAEGNFESGFDHGFDNMATFNGK